MNRFAERLKELREERGMSQHQLSKETGITQASISFWESGIKKPSIDSIIVLTNYFGCTAGYLIGTES